MCRPQAMPFPTVDDLVVVELVGAQVPPVATDADRLMSLLPLGERRRALRFARAGDRARFITARVMMRGLLGRRINVVPLKVQIARTESGKPFVRGGPSFSISHSGRWVVGAIAESAVGVDIEIGGSVADVGPLLDRALGAGLAGRVRVMPAQEHGRAFLGYWVILEAVLKASGLGLVGLSSLQARVGSIASFATGADLRFAGRTWRLARIGPLMEDLVGAVAWEVSAEEGATPSPLSLRLKLVDPLELYGEASRG